MKKLLMITVALVALTLGLASQAMAGTGQDNQVSQNEGPVLVPFSGSLEGMHASRSPVAPSVVRDTFEVTGEAVGLGRFALLIEATVDFGARPVTGAGTYSFTSADGDRLVADHTGSSALVVPGLVLITEHAVVDPDGSTGRFAGTTGTFTVRRLADAATGVGGITSGSIEGTLSRPGR